MKLKAVVLDMDGTLLNTLPDITAVVNGILSSIGMTSRTQDQVRCAVGAGVEQLLLKLEVPADRIGELSLQIASKYAEMNETRAEVYLGIESMLGGLVKSGVPIAVLSNKPTSGLKAAVRRHFGEIPFTAVVGAEPGRPAKPSPDALRGILEYLGIPAEQAVMVGDGEPDVLVARAVGMVHLAALWGYRSMDELRGIGAVNFAESPEEALRLILHGELLR